MMSLAPVSVALYGAGVTSSLSPCVLPVVPGYLGVLFDARLPGERRRGLPIALFAFGTIGTFAALGGVTTSVGVSLSGTVGWLQRVAGFALIICGLLMVLGGLGLTTTEVRVVRVVPAQRHLRALLLGIGCGAAWSPCVGPLLGVALTAASGSGSVYRGTWLLVCFGCGVLTPFVAVVFVGTQVLGTRTRVAGRAMTAGSAALVVCLGVLLLGGWYDGLAQRLSIGT